MAAFKLPWRGFWFIRRACDRRIQRREWIKKIGTFIDYSKPNMLVGVNYGLLRRDTIIFWRFRQTKRNGGEGDFRLLREIIYYRLVFNKIFHAQTIRLKEIWHDGFNRVVWKWHATTNLPYYQQLKTGIVTNRIWILEDSKIAWYEKKKKIETNEFVSYN